MAASNGAPCRDAGDGEQGGGGGGVTGCYRGHRLGMAGKGAFPPSVDKQCLSSVMHKAGGCRAGFIVVNIKNFSFLSSVFFFF